MNELCIGVLWRVQEFFLPDRKVEPAWALAGRGLLLGLVAAYSVQFYRMNMMQLTESNGSYALHVVHLVFHEAGHIIFSWFGSFMHVLGGSLFQVLVYLIWFVAARYWGNDAFAGALCLWLAGTSLVDVAPYINDARSLQLTLLGGGTGREVEGHDWEYILTELNLLRQDIYISRWVLSAGRWLMSLSLLWATVVLWVQFNRRRLPSEAAE